MLQPLKNTTRLLGGRETDRLYHVENRKMRVKFVRKRKKYYDIL
jgi:hypothetical protein